ncbi:MAG: flagellar biosynthetic protein FliR [Naasia sp.]|jgi:flagellar biosynthetic protein FliR|uniref:flagellar biosynthetic protein FliR n=1 Tax=Naasia sp. TaxID=2546198 RepID=UPI0026314F77|nr:flagellar biosynthetic protein FliR [Naasia sp.]MCU1570984.1 flagellar biosynthetic protein FliR [Naasia sp.]
MNLAIDMAWVESSLLAGVRMVAFLVIAPPFSYNGFPLRIKGMLAVALSLVVAPRVSQGYTSLDTGPFLFALVSQLLVGALLGFFVFLVFSAVQSAGGLIDLFGGFQLAQAFDPQSLVNGAQFTRLMHLIALALLFTSGGDALIIGGLVRTFDALPVTGMLDMSDPAGQLVGGVSQMFLASVQIAGPLIVVLFLADVGLALLTRVAPQMNAFAMGYPLKVLVTLLVAGVVFLALPRVVGSLVDDALGLMGVVS